MNELAGLIALVLEFGMLLKTAFYFLLAQLVIFGIPLGLAFLFLQAKKLFEKQKVTII